VEAIIALALLVLVIYCCIRLWFCYIRFWAWLGGKIGEAIGREIDKRISPTYQDQRNGSITVTICHERSNYFDDVLEDIQRKKRPNNG
jgi:hypothetical protein